MRAPHPLRQAVHEAVFAERHRVGSWADFRPRAVVEKFSGSGVPRSTLYDWISESSARETALAIRLDGIRRQLHEHQRTIAAGRPVPPWCLPFAETIGALLEAIDIVETAALAELPTL